MQVLAFNGPLALFIQGLAFALVIGALFVIVHALGRPADRWRVGWVRWVWVALSAVFVLSLVFALIWPNDTTYTIVGFAFLGALVVEVAYLLRVVFPGSRTTVVEGPPCDEQEAETPEDAADTSEEPAEPAAEEPIFDPTFLPETTPEEQSPDA